MKNIAVCILLLLVSSMYALPFEALDVTGGLLWIGNGNGPDESTGAPGPITRGIGIHVSIPVQSRIILEPGLHIGGYNYGFAGGERPRPVQIEHREMFVLILIADITMLYSFPLGEHVTVSPGVSAACIVRLPVITASGEETRTGDMLAYFLGGGRWLLPGVLVKLDWAFSERFGFVFRPGARLPIFHLWDGEELPLYDQMIVYCDFGVSFRL